jgi:hypothetical protein
MPAVQVMTVVANCQHFLEFSRSVPQDILAEIASGSQVSSTLSDEVYQQAVTLLQQVKSSCVRSPLASALFMEELAIAVRQGVIHEKVEVGLKTLLFSFTFFYEF